MPAGRPRKKNRTIESCLSCGNLGYRFRKECYNAGFYKNNEDAVANSYYYFRHEDRSLSDCYIDKQVKEREREREKVMKNKQENPNSPFFVFNIKNENKLKNLKKLFGKYVREIRNCSIPISPNEDQALDYAAESFNFFLMIMIWISHTYYVLLKARIKGNDLPKDLLDDIFEMSKLIQEYFGPNPEEVFQSLTEPARQVMLSIDHNYLEPIRKYKRELRRIEASRKYNRPPRILDF